MPSFAPDGSYDSGAAGSTVVELPRLASEPSYLPVSPASTGQTSSRPAATTPQGPPIVQRSTSPGPDGTRSDGTRTVRLGLGAPLPAPDLPVSRRSREQDRASGEPTVQTWAATTPHAPISHAAKSKASSSPAPKPQASSSHAPTDQASAAHVLSPPATPRASDVGAVSPSEATPATPPPAVPGPGGPVTDVGGAGPSGRDQIDAADLTSVTAEPPTAPEPIDLSVARSTSDETPEPDRTTPKSTSSSPDFSPPGHAHDGAPSVQPATDVAAGMSASDALAGLTSVTAEPPTAPGPIELTVTRSASDQTLSTDRTPGDSTTAHASDATSGAWAVQRATDSAAGTAVLAGPVDASGDGGPGERDEVTSTAGRAEMTSVTAEPPTAPGPIELTIARSATAQTPASDLVPSRGRPSSPEYSSPQYSSSGQPATDSRSADGARDGGHPPELPPAGSTSVDSTSATTLESTTASVATAASGVQSVQRAADVAAAMDLSDAPAGLTTVTVEPPPVPGPIELTVTRSAADRTPSPEPAHPSATDHSSEQASSPTGASSAGRALSSGVQPLQPLQRIPGPGGAATGPGPRPVDGRPGGSGLTGSR